MANCLVMLCVFLSTDILNKGLSELLYVKNTRFSADMNNILNATTYKKFDSVVTSSSECAVLCSTYACDTFYFDGSSRLCRYVIFLTYSTVIPETPNGMENFIIGKSACRAGWLQYGKHCILFSKTKSDWHDAKITCEQMGSHLISLQSRDMNDFIIKRAIIFGFSAWIGARKTDVWRWEDNSAEIDVKSTSWSFSNPSGNGNCMQIWQPEYYKWDDFYCDVEEHFICQSTFD